MSTRRSFLATTGAAVASTLLSRKASAQPASVPTGSPPYRNPHLPIDQRVHDLLGRMTLEEKAAQLVSASLDTARYNDSTGTIVTEPVKALLQHGTGQLTRPGFSRDSHHTATVCNQLQHFLIEHTRLGIPALVHEEALHGVWGKGVTSYPQSIALAGTFNPALLEEICTAIAAEARARGAHQVLAPMLGVARDPRWGRCQETYGEDPYLASRLAVAAVNGFQGRDALVGKGRVISTVKAFVADSQPQGGHNIAPCDFPVRSIHENFLPPFRAALVEAQAHAVMPAYNEIDGIPCHASRWVLQKLLREDCGFKGITVSDYLGIPFLMDMHHVVANKEEAAKKALEAGVDIELPAPSCYPTLPAQVRQGLIAESTLDRSVARILRLKFMLGLFENPFVDAEAAVTISTDPAHAALAARAARESIVLLKNQNNLLPLDATKLRSLAVIGPNAAECHLGSYSGDPLHTVSILEGLRNKAANRFTVNYAEGCRILAKGGEEEGHQRLPSAADSQKLIDAAVTVARNSDVVLLAIGDNEATDTERVDRDSLDLLGAQDALVRAIVATGKPTIVILINGRPISINAVVEEVPAILEGWFLGQDTGNAVADVLFGDTNPAARLAMTFPRNVGQVPAFYNYKPSARRREYLLSPHGPLFPFGHGLSYTTFAYANLRTSPSSIPTTGQTTVSVDITNTGHRAGDEVAQLYLRDDISSVTRPVQELAGFQRLHLAPGETRTVSFRLTFAELSFLNESMQRVVEPGDFTLMVGPSSAVYQTTKLRVV